MMRRFLQACAAALILGVGAETTAAAEIEIPATTPVVPWTRFSIQYTVNDIGSAGAETVDFYITTDMGASWKHYGADPDAKSPMAITVPGDGIYGFMTVGTDRVGNREREPVAGTKPETLIIVDRTPPTAKWLAPTATALLGTGGVELAWEAADTYLSDAPISLEYSADAGTSWLPLRDRLPASGKYLWQPTASLGGAIQFRLIARDRAGNRLILGCPNRILTDSIPPTVGITGPTNSANVTVDLSYAAADNKGGSGLARVTLYYTLDNGEKWFRYGDDQDLQSPFRFTSQVGGPVGLMLVATDGAGNRSPLPRAGGSAPFTLSIDNEAPQVTFDPQLPDGKTNLRGGIPVVLRWKAVDTNIAQDSASLEFSSDGGSSWELVASGLPVNGPYKWSVPTRQSEECQLRVTVQDQLQNRGTGTTLLFSIDSKEPGTRITDVTPLEGTAPTPRPMSDEGSQSLRPRAQFNIGEETLDAAPLPETVLLPEVPTEGTVAAGVLPEARPTARTTPSIDVLPTNPVTPAETLGDTEIPARPTANPTPSSAASTQDDWATPITEGTPTETTPTETAPSANTVSRLPDVPPAVPETTPGIPAPSSPTDQVLADAERLFNAGRISQALSRCNEAMAQDPNNAQGYDLLARINYEKHDYPSAVGYAAKAIQLNKNEPAHWHNLGEAAYSQARQLARMIALKKKSTETPPQEIMDLTTQRDKAIILARKSFARVTLLAPQEKKGWDRLGDTVYMHARFITETDPQTAAQYYREAITAYGKAYAIGEATYRETFQLGVSNYRLSEITQDRTLLTTAQKQLEKAVEDAKNEVHPREAFWYLAEIHQKLGDTQAAERYWNEVIRSYNANDPKEAKFHEEAKGRLEQMKAGM